MKFFKGYFLISIIFFSLSMQNAFSSQAIPFEDEEDANLQKVARQIKVKTAFYTLEGLSQEYEAQRLPLTVPHFPFFCVATDGNETNDDVTSREFYRSYKLDRNRFWFSMLAQYFATSTALKYQNALEAQDQRDFGPLKSRLATYKKKFYFLPVPLEFSFMEFLCDHKVPVVHPTQWDEMQNQFLFHFLEINKETPSTFIEGVVALMHMQMVVHDFSFDSLDFSAQSLRTQVEKLAL
jgi:hypothetical protein